MNLFDAQMTTALPSHISDTIMSDYTHTLSNLCLHVWRADSILRILLQWMFQDFVVCSFQLWFSGIRLMGDLEGDTFGLFNPDLQTFLSAAERTNKHSFLQSHSFLTNRGLAISSGQTFVKM